MDITVKQLYDLYNLELECVLLADYGDSVEITLHDSKSNKFKKEDWDRLVESFNVVNSGESSIMHITVRKENR